MSRTFSTNNGSVESLNVFFRWGCREKLAVRRAFGDTGGSGQRTGTPMGAAIGGPGMQGAVDHLGHLVVLIGAGASRTQLVM